MSRVVLQMGLGLLLLLAGTLRAAEPVELSEYKTVDKAITAKEIKEKPPAAQPAFLGVHTVDEGGKVVAGDVATDSPAAKAGLNRGDVLTTVDGNPLAGADALREALQAKGPGATVKLVVQ